MDNPPQGSIHDLAVLYDRFANALDQMSPDRDRDLAEQTFGDELAKWHDGVQGPKPDFRTFRKGVIVRCKRHLKNPQNP